MGPENKPQQVAGEKYDDTTLQAMPDAYSTELILFRHGEVVGQADRSLRGQLDVDLSETGRSQHAALEQWVTTWEAQPERLISSDLKRCTNLAERIGRVFGTALELDPNLREQNLGQWQGQAWEQITARDPERVRDYWDDYLGTAPPGGESLADMGRRVDSWWQAIEPSIRGKRVVIVTHAGVIRCLLCQLFDRPLSEALRFAPAVASHTKVLHSAAGSVLVTLGERPWLFGSDKT